VLEDGKGYAEFWNRIKQTVENDVSKIKPGYWETIFRTNTQSAYVAGKLQQFEKSGVAAYQLMVIEDVRTSQICRNLLNKNSGYGIILPVEHPFWQKYGFPPYHFNCRSSIRGVWPSQVGKIGNVVTNPGMKSIQLRNFKPQGDFGGNPLVKGSWWELTAGQMEQAKEFGVLHILQLSQANIKTGARSSVVNKILNSDILERTEIAENYYIAIRNSDNSKMIELIAKNTGFDFQDVEKIINHIFKEKHRFENGELKFFNSDEYIVMALERMKTKEYTNQDITLLNHELLELTYMKNKKYNVYEVAHAMANKKYNWESLL
jgi:SPP1 gp7 family putative phage head morphogenesis protein